MAKVQDTYNPVTGEYVKRISDWIDLDGSKNWTVGDKRPDSYRLMLSNVFDGNMDNGNKANLYDYASRKLGLGVNTPSDYVMDVHKYNMFGSNWLLMYMGNNFTGFNNSVAPSSAEAKAYFHGWRMCNSDSTSPYYKSEVPYNPATWAGWSAYSPNAVKDSTGATLTSDGTTYVRLETDALSFKSSTKYGLLYNVVSSTATYPIWCSGGIADNPLDGHQMPVGVGNQKYIGVTNALGGKRFGISIRPTEPAGKYFKIKDIRIFELPSGSQIEADFTNLSADELSAKYTFNGLCVKNWKKVTDGTGLTSTLPTASYAGYTPYRMIYQLATPEISYLTPKATIPLYDTNTIVETDTQSDCKADVTVGYKLKSGATAVTGDITAPTPDYMSAVNSVSEDGLGKGIVRSPNMIANGNFANGTTGWSIASATTVSSVGSELIITSLSTSNNEINQAVKNQIDDKIYYSCEMLSNSNLDCCEFLGNPPSDKVYHSGSGMYERLRNVITASIANTSMRFLSSSRSGDISGAPVRIKKPMLINLTASFGAGNEPTKEQCDILFATWQDKASTQATLPTLRKIGTVADTYNPETGVLVQRIGKKVFDGTEAWTKYVGEDAKNYVYYASVSNTKIAFQVSSCSHFKNIDSAWRIGGLGTYSDHAFVNNKYFQTDIPTLTQFKAYLAQQYANGTPVTVYYQLATPVVTTITTGQLSTFHPNTVIETDSSVKGTIVGTVKIPDL